MSTTTTEADVIKTDAVKKSLGSFKHSRDIEKLYRFIHENNLRREAGLLLSTIYSKVLSTTASKKRKPKKQLLQ